jgi:cytoskeleton protein RodZ
MEMDASNTAAHEPAPKTGFGERLVAAREAQGLTLEVVASKLRLSARTLQALESNRFEDLPEPIFVRGYLRAYARLLEIDQKVVIAEYDRLVGTRDPVLRPSSKRRRQPNADYPYIRGALALLVVAILVLFGSWWYSRLQHDVPAQSQTASLGIEQPSESEPVLTSSPPIDSEDRGAGLIAALPPDSVLRPPANEAAEVSATVGEPESPMDKAAAAAEPALSELGESPATTNTDTVVERQDMESPAGSAAPDLPIAPPASEHGRLVKASRAPTGADVLIIRASDKSWAEVVDANGYQLLYYPLHADMVLRLQGQAPFRVFLGNAPAVDLSLDNKRFDHSQFHRQNNTARFTVGDDS